MVTRAVGIPNKNLFHDQDFSNPISMAFSVNLGLLTAKLLPFFIGVGNKNRHSPNAIAFVW
jgi:hypothetical protein